jgi:hypothetical protein
MNYQPSLKHAFENLFIETQKYAFLASDMVFSASVSEYTYTSLNFEERITLRKLKFIRVFNKTKKLWKRETGRKYRGKN